MLIFYRLNPLIQTIKPLVLKVGDIAPGERWKILREAIDEKTAKGGR